MIGQLLVALTVLSSGLGSPGLARNISQNIAFVAATKPPQPRATPPRKQPPQLAIVIDDVGLRPEVLDVFLAIEPLRKTITWAVIPHAPHAVALTRRLVAADEAVIAHIPMEPANPKHLAPHLGPYLRIGSSPAALTTELERQLDHFPTDLRPFVRGINNHQGSGLTASEPAMSAVMQVLAKRKLYFLDSRTTADTVAERLARKHGVPTTRRNVFLDNVRRVEAIVERLDEAARYAQKHGHAVAIGHPYPETATALAYWVNQRLGNVTLVRVERFVRGMLPARN